MLTVNVMKCNKHQQVNKKLIICITETKSLVCIALFTSKSEANKILEVSCF